MKTKVFGRSKKKVSKDGLMEMSEVTFVGSPADLRMIAAFLTRSAEEIEKHGKSFGHNHLRDEKAFASWPDDGVDVIVTQSQ
jgi:hypothetical protein